MRAPAVSDEVFPERLVALKTDDRHRVTVGEEALSWYGIARVGRKEEWPSWTPTADIKKRFADSGVEPFLSTPEEFAKFLAVETPRYAKIVKDARIPAQ